MRVIIYIIVIALIVGGAYFALTQFSDNSGTIIQSTQENQDDVPVSSQPSPGTETYENPYFKVSFHYPESWEPNPLAGSFPAQDGVPVRYTGENGFFAIDAVNQTQDSLETAVQEIAYHRLLPYGENPAILRTTLKGQEAAYIMPSDDQREDFQNEAAFIVRYPEPVRIEVVPERSDEYSFFVLYADKDYIKEIAQTISFLE